MFRVVNIEELQGGQKFEVRGWLEGGGSEIKVHRLICRGRARVTALAAGIIALFIAAWHLLPPQDLGKVDDN